MYLITGKSCHNPIHRHLNLNLSGCTQLSLYAPLTLLYSHSSFQCRQDTAPCSFESSVLSPPWTNPVSPLDLHVSSLVPGHCTLVTVSAQSKWAKTWREQGERKAAVAKSGVWFTQPIFAHPLTTCTLHNSTRTPVHKIYLPAGMCLSWGPDVWFHFKGLVK